MDHFLAPDPTILGTFRLLDEPLSHRSSYISLVVHHRGLGQTHVDMCGIRTPDPSVPATESIELELKDTTWLINFLSDIIYSRQQLFVRYDFCRIFNPRLRLWWGCTFP